jgi:methionyl aminopeptidase
MVMIKSKREIEKMRQAGRIVAEVLQSACDWVQPGITTAELDRRAERIIVKNGGTPAFKGYRGFPAATCISVNEEVVHGIPGPRRLREGDIFSLDVGVRYRSYHGDGARTYAVARVSPEAQALLDCTAAALEAAIRQTRVNNRVSDISRAVQSCAEGRGYSVVKQFVGHGIGAEIHEDPQVPNYLSDAFADGDPVLTEGMVLAIEPMVNLGGDSVRTQEDGWTVVTQDGTISAHFEHTVAVTPEGPEVLTRFE